MLTGVPLVMGDKPKGQLAKAEANLGKGGRAVGALRPVYLLVAWPSWCPRWTMSTR